MKEITELSNYQLIKFLQKKKILAFQDDNERLFNGNNLYLEGVKRRLGYEKM
jgi:hypothetical protein